MFDVGALLEDAETKNAALERVEELEENMSHVRTHKSCFMTLKKINIYLFIYLFITYASFVSCTDIFICSYVNLCNVMLFSTVFESILNDTVNLELML